MPVRRQRYYFARTVIHIVPLAERFARWYVAWRQDFADLAWGDLFRFGLGGRRAPGPGD